MKIGIDSTLEDIRSVEEWAGELERLASAHARRTGRYEEADIMRGCAALLRQLEEEREDA